MKTPAKSLTRLLLGTVVGIGVVSLLLPQLSWAQATRANPLEDFETQENRNDPFSSGKEQDSFGGVYDLIHRAQMGNMRSWEDFSAEQNENLNDAAAQFRARQRQRIQGQQQTSPANPVTITQPGN
jgi:hypothetical protein